MKWEGSPKPSHLSIILKQSPYPTCMLVLRNSFYFTAFNSSTPRPACNSSQVTPSLLSSGFCFSVLWIYKRRQQQNQDDEQVHNDQSELTNAFKSLALKLQSRYADRRQKRKAFYKVLYCVSAQILLWKHTGDEHRSS